MGNTFRGLFYLFQRFNFHCLFMEFAYGMLVEVDGVASLIRRDEPNVVPCKGLGGVDIGALPLELA